MERPGEAGKVRQRKRLEVGIGKCERESERETAENWSRERLQLGGYFVSGGPKFNYGKKAVVTTRWLWGSGNNGYGSNCTGGGDQ